MGTLITLFVNLFGIIILKQLDDFEYNDLAL